MLDQLDRTVRLRLLRIVTAVAWVDGEVHEHERQFAKRLIDRMKLSPGDREIALGYLDQPPRAHEVDPTKLDRDRRLEVLILAREMVNADGSVNDAEQDSIAALESLLGV
jgi:uncharacterized tellurite resistance protein B-like protein